LGLSELGETFTEIAKITETMNKGQGRLKHEQCLFFSSFLMTPLLVFWQFKIHKIISFIKKILQAG